uniref:Fem-1 homolog A n=1 Tax=Cyanistes caeruleus TaxID=156563 RepID=A0A8C0Z9E4_CYACU
MISCYKGHREIARYLLEKGADVNRRSVKGNTALHDCAESGSLEILQLLLRSKCGADPDSRDYDNNTPLHVAARNNCPLIMSALMEAGAHMDATNAFKQTAYELLDEKLLSHPAEVVQLEGSGWLCQSAQGRRCAELCPHLSPPSWRVGAGEEEAPELMAVPRCHLQVPALSSAVCPQKVTATIVS